MSVHDNTKGPHVAIEFPMVEELTKFLHCVADHLDGSDAMNPPKSRVYTCMITPFWYADSWQYGINPADFSPPQADWFKIDAVPTGHADFNFSFHVAFPCKHYPAVLAAVEKAAQEARH